MKRGPGLQRFDALSAFLTRFSRGKTWLLDWRMSAGGRA